MSTFDEDGRDDEHLARIDRAARVYTRYLNAKGGVPYAIRFKALMKKWGIFL